MFPLRASFALILVGLLLSTAVLTPAQKDSRTKDAARHSSDAAKTFTEIMNVKDKAIPKELLDTAEAIAVFPGVLKGAFLVGARGGQGVISKRVKGGWSAPAFFNIGGGSFGPQIGAQKTDYIFLIMNQEGVSGLLKDKFELGGEAGVAAGPIGREAAAFLRLCRPFWVNELLKQKCKNSTAQSSQSTVTLSDRFVPCIVAGIHGR